MSESFSSKFSELIIDLGEGNPGALTVLSRLVKERSTDEIMYVLLKCQANKIYGSNIWVIYKRHCGMDMDRFVTYSFDHPVSF